MISISNITKSYGKLQVLKGISAELEGGSVVSLIGPNASGKTTLIKSMLGLVRPDSGSIRIQGRDIASDAQARSLLGYMPQIGRYPENMRVGQVFDLLRDLRGGNAPVDEELIETFRLKEQFHKPFRALSGGTVQKVSACIAFLFDPPVLILDEPTAGLDPLSSEILKEKVKRSHGQGKLVLITSHILSDLEDITGHILYLQDGLVRFFKPMHQVMEEAGETRIDKAIARVMRNEGNA